VQQQRNLSDLYLELLKKGRRTTTTKNLKRNGYWIRKEGEKKNDTRDIVSKAKNMIPVVCPWASGSRLQTWGAKRFPNMTCFGVSFVEILSEKK
jgi:hypothetical protein